ncbi:adenosylcobinamide-phosphate synthase CbiB [Thermus sp.]|uniref:adenosylcobinamide-phosphate synthase CbiB n=1 Tax=Thermus sp. TaxID=275 RepID=UPI00307D1F32
MSLLLALLLDALLGEPPERLHPVVLMGRYLGWAWPRVQGFWSGAFYWGLGALLFTLPAFLLDLLLRPLAWGWVLLGLLLKPLFSLRMLLLEVVEVERALGEGLEAGRSRLARIVSRKTGDLGPEEVREAALESLSENLADSLVAPLLYYALLGLGGAALYRYANTADAMWGYPEHGARGAFAARADDLLNLLPARLTALLLCPPRLWPRLLKEARKTPSPNAGYPMAALALRLGVRLRKRGVYALNPQAPSPTPQDLRRGMWLVGGVGYVFGGLLGVALW